MAPNFYRQIYRQSGVDPLLPDGRLLEEIHRWANGLRCISQAVDHVL
jgi:hypothetical protein